MPDRLRRRQKGHDGWLRRVRYRAKGICSQPDEHHEQQQQCSAQPWLWPGCWRYDRLWLHDPDARQQLLFDMRRWLLWRAAIGQQANHLLELLDLGTAAGAAAQVGGYDSGLTGVQHSQSKGGQGFGRMFTHDLVPGSSPALTGLVRKVLKHKPLGL